MAGDEGQAGHPGLIDCHTHLIFAGSRAEEFELRQKGVPYAEIARKGGGIISTVRATRAASEEQLFELALPRVKSLIREGVTTVEIKSGYGLTLEDELKMLRVARRLGRRCRSGQDHPAGGSCGAAGVSRRSRLLGRDHLSGDHPTAAEAGLADAVDVFCEHIGFRWPRPSRSIWRRINTVWR